jgi:hypothetical protein
MVPFYTRSPRWRTVTALALLVGALLSAVLAQKATAGLRACRADPIVWLSNGQVVQMIVQIAAPADDVRQITYTLHAPHGTTVTRIMYTGGALSSKEQVYLVSDMPHNQYAIDTLATVRGNGIPVTATSNLIGQSWPSATGVNGQHLTVYFDLNP